MEINSTLTAFRNVLTRVRKAIFDSRAYWLSFLLPVVILFGAYIVFQVWPFGSVLSLDLNAQYVYYYDYMYDVFAGDESIWYSWSRNLSGEFMGIIGYYLASPFNLLVWIFPREWITEGLMTMMLAKAGAAGLTCALLFGDVGAVRLLHRADHEPHVAGRSGRASAGGYGRRAYL